MPTVALLCLSVFEFGRGVGFYCEMNWPVLGSAYTHQQTAICALNGVRRVFVITHLGLLKIAILLGLLLRHFSGSNCAEDPVCGQRLKVHFVHVSSVTFQCCKR